MSNEFAVFCLCPLLFCAVLVDLAMLFLFGKICKLIRHIQQTNFCFENNQRNAALDDSDLTRLFNRICVWTYERSILGVFTQNLEHEW